MANPFPFVGASYEARSRAFDAQRCVNLYPEVSGSGTSKSAAMLIGTPGLATWCTLPTGPVRGLVRGGAGTALAVGGSNIYRLDAAGAATLLGAVSAGTAPVSMASNGTTVLIADGNLWAVNVAAGTVTSLGRAASRVDFIDGYFVFDEPGTGRFHITSLYGTAVDDLDFATAEGAPDKLVSLIVDHRELWLFGETSTEVFFNSGNSDFPFERIQGAFLETGCAAPASVAKLDNSVVWLGADERGQGIVWRAAGYQPQRISTHAIEYALAQAGDLSSARAWSYKQEGHEFYALSVGDRTWCFDASTSLWHERAWRDANGQLHAHRGACHLAFAGHNLVGDRETGAIYRLDLDTYTDAGAALPRIRQCPHIAAAGRRQFFKALQVDMEAGVGLPSGQGSDPQAVLQWSDDGGATWSSELWVSIGRLGERQARALWRRLGSGRDRVFRLTITDPVRVVITGATLDAAAGTS